MAALKASTDEPYDGWDLGRECSFRKTCCIVSVSKRCSLEWMQALEWLTISMSSDACALFKRLRSIKGIQTCTSRRYDPIGFYRYVLFPSFLH